VATCGSCNFTEVSENEICGMCNGHACHLCMTFGGRIGSAPVCKKCNEYLCARCVQNKYVKECYRCGERVCESCARGDDGMLGRLCNGCY